MVASANRIVERFVDQETRSYQMLTNIHVYKGTFVGLSAGYARPLVAGDTFLGVAYEEMDNTGGASGAKTVRVFSVSDFSHALSGAALTNIDDPVFASADDTLTFTAGSNSFVGYCVDVPSAGKIVLRIAPLAVKRQTLTAKDATTVDATYGSEEQGVIGNNRTRIEEIETALQSIGLLA